MREQWTFASQFPPHREMSNSRARFATREEALRKAVEWLEVCAINDHFPAVQIVKLEEPQPRVLPERDDLHPSQIGDPVERIISQALQDAGILHRPGGDGELDYWLTDLGIWIECKRAWTPRAIRQLERHERVILVQSIEAAAVMRTWITGVTDVSE